MSDKYDPANSDYAIDYKIRNARIKLAMARAGFKNARQLALVAKVPANIVGDFLNMKRTPLKNNGDYKLPVLKIANALNVLPEDLFSEVQHQVKMVTNKGTAYLTENQARKLAEVNYQNFIGSTVEDSQTKLLISESLLSARYEISNALTVFSPKKRKVIRMRFGLPPYDRAYSVEEISDMLGIPNKTHVRMIISKCLRMLRHPGRCKKLLQLYVDGVVEE